MNPTDRHDGPPSPGPYLQTVSGRWLNPFDPDPDQIDIGDIARALSNQCRFGGHCRAFYSVAQHSVLVSVLVEQRGGDVEDVFAALMHDAARPIWVTCRIPSSTAARSAPRSERRRSISSARFVSGSASGSTCPS
jgi:hypothetical protein